MSALVWSALLTIAFIGFYLIGFGIGRRTVEQRAAAGHWSLLPPVTFRCLEPGCRFDVASTRTEFVLRVGEAHQAMHRAGDRP